MSDSTNALEGIVPFAGHPPLLLIPSLLALAFVYKLIPRKGLTRNEENSDPVFPNTEFHQTYCVLLGVQAVNCASLVYLYRSDGPPIMTLESMTVDAFRGTTLRALMASFFCTAYSAFVASFGIAQMLHKVSAGRNKKLLVLNYTALIIIYTYTIGASVVGVVVPGVTMKSYIDLVICGEILAIGVSVLSLVLLALFSKRATDGEKPRLAKMSDVVMSAVIISMIVSNGVNLADSYRVWERGSWLYWNVQLMEFEFFGNMRVVVFLCLYSVMREFATGQAQEQVLAEDQKVEPIEEKPKEKLEKLEV